MDSYSPSTTVRIPISVYKSALENQKNFSIIQLPCTCCPNTTHSFSIDSQLLNYLHLELYPINEAPNLFSRSITPPPTIDPQSLIPSSSSSSSSSDSSSDSESEHNSPPPQKKQKNNPAPPPTTTQPSFTSNPLFNGCLHKIATHYFSKIHLINKDSFYKNLFSKTIEFLSSPASTTLLTELKNSPHSILPKAKNRTNLVILTHSLRNFVIWYHVYFLDNTKKSNNLHFITLALSILYHVDPSLKALTLDLNKRSSDQNNLFLNTLEEIQDNPRALKNIPKNDPFYISPKRFLEKVEKII